MEYQPGYCGPLTGDDADPLIAGFIVADANKSVIVVASGPSFLPNSILFLILRFMLLTWLLELSFLRDSMTIGRIVQMLTTLRIVVVHPLMT